uniref:G-protein coupled receptors family 1 profile domain-containing protein n=1 Tax=Lates calcarifer TaxID=8187 RepID=A0A4W6EP65_LATCA
IYILVIAVLGIIFNVFVLMVFCLHKKACTVAEIYLTRKFNWPFGGSLCKLVNLSINMNVYCSIYSLVLVSIDRYMALVHPLSHERLRRPKFAKLSCLLVWALGLLLSVPTLIYREVGDPCKLNATLCYLNYQNTTVQLLCEGMDQILRKKSIKLPLWSWHLEGCSLDTVIETCRQIVNYLSFFNSVLNPILYVIVGKNFREKVMELSKQWSCKKRTTLTPPDTYLHVSRSDQVQKYQSYHLI